MLSEYWTVQQILKMSVSEMQMAGWMCVMRSDKIRNDYNWPEGALTTREVK